MRTRKIPLVFSLFFLALLSLGVHAVEIKSASYDESSGTLNLDVYETSMGNKAFGLEGGCYPTFPIQTCVFVVSPQIVGVFTAEERLKLNFDLKSLIAVRSSTIAVGRVFGTAEVAAQAGIQMKPRVLSFRDLIGEPGTRANIMILADKGTTYSFTFTNP